MRNPRVIATGARSVGCEPEQSNRSPTRWGLGSGAVRRFLFTKRRVPLDCNKSLPKEGTVRRSLLAALLIVVVGCVGSATPRNPLKPTAVAPTTSNTAAATKSSSAAPATSVAAVDADDAKTLDQLRREFQALGRLEQMKLAFKARQDLQREILKMAEHLSPEEFVEINKWLEQFGVQLTPRKSGNSKQEKSSSGDEKREEPQPKSRVY